MRLMSKFALAGAAACALAGTAYAADHAIHRMNVALPDGSVAQVLYAGDVAPKVEFVPVEESVMPVALLDSPFADFDRMFAALDQQAAAMMQQAATLPAAPVGPNGKIDQAALKNMPAGTVSYSYYSTSTGNGGCTQSYQMTSYGNGAQPKVVSQTSGDCTKAGVLQAAPKPAKTEPAPKEVAPPKVVAHDAV